MVRGGPDTQVCRHFAHLGSGCSHESIVHRVAKMRVAWALEVARDGGEAIRVRRSCSEHGCGGSWTSDFRPAASSVVAVEHRLPNARVVDVAVLKGGHIQAAVEIYHTHPVDDGKARALEGVPLAEIRASAAVDDPFNWEPTSRLTRKRPCPRCVEEGYHGRRRSDAEWNAWNAEKCSLARSGPLGRSSARFAATMKARLRDARDRRNRAARERGRRRWRACVSPRWAERTSTGGVRFNFGQRILVGEAQIGLDGGIVRLAWTVPQPE